MLSVIIPVYNSEQYLERCIDSVLRQTYTDMELIIVDDGSRDSSSDIIRRFADKDKRITVIWNEHRGVMQARKDGIRAATGEYATFVDSDDWVEPDCYAAMMNEIYDADLMIGGHVIELEDGSAKRWRQPVKAAVYSGNDLCQVWSRMFVNQMQKHISPYLWDKIFRTELLKTVSGFLPTGINVGEDRCIYYQAALKAAKIAFTEVYKYHYAVRNDSLGHAEYADYLIDLGLFYKCIREAIKRDCESNEELLFFLKREIAMRLSGECLNRLRIPLKARTWYYPYRGRLCGKNIALYGAGDVGKSYWHQIKRYGENNLVAWVDRDYDRCLEEGLEVRKTDELFKLEYDYVIIALENEEAAREVSVWLTDRGICKDKILWHAPKRL